MYCAVLVTRSDRGLEKAVQINTENNDLFSDRILLFCLLNQILISDWIGGVPGKEGGPGPDRTPARSLVLSAIQLDF